MINIFLINQWECQPFAGAWQLIQEWFVSCTSTHIITQTPQILRFFIRYNNYQYTYIILCFYVWFTSCCVQNLTHCTLPDKVSGTGIFDSVLNITSNTATAASDQSIQVCSHTANTVHDINILIYNVVDRQILTELFGKLLTGQENCHPERIPRKTPQLPCLLTCIRYD